MHLSGPFFPFYPKVPLYNSVSDLRTSFSSAGKMLGAHLLISRGGGKGEKGFS